MTGYVLAVLLSLVVAGAVAWALPAWAVRRLTPALAGSGMLVTNYRGRRIPTGLGVVWLVWAAGAGVLQVVVRGMVADPFVAPPVSALGWVGDLAYDTMLLLPPLLVAGAFAFGMVDDVFGSHEAKGFRGHLREMAAGRLTTGGLKLVGIGLLALAAGGSVYSVNAAISESVVSRTWEPAGILTAAVAWLCAAGVIALTANFVNLTDLRPGRALKAYCALVVGGFVVTASASIAVILGPGANAQTYAAAGALAPFMPAVALLARLLVLAVLVLGPVLAVWRLDLGELGMLGDAGANAMGAFAGFLLVARAPLWLEVVLLVVLLALNLASEKVSFSRVIERVALLKWFDDLGRGHALAAGGVGDNGDGGVGAGGPGAEGDGTRRDGGA